MKCAVIQLNSSNNKSANLDRVSKFIREAVANNAELIALPEVFNCRGSLEESFTNCEIFDSSNSLEILKQLAKELNIWILSGSMLAYENNSKFPFNTSTLITPQGELQCKYSKIHLFSVELDGKKIDENQRSIAGSKPVIAEITNKSQQHLKIGMSICYDLRFPELYRIYAQEKVEILYIPSAFTQKTGEAHWEILLRARAIENQTYVLAPNQFGDASGTNCYGNSMIIDPWGTVIARASNNQEEIIYAEINLDLLQKVRRSIPALEHRKL